jgi:hypothetical protein
MVNIVGLYAAQLFFKCKKLEKKVKIDLKKASHYREA